MTKPDIASRVAQLRKPQTKAAQLTKEEKLAFLAEILRTPVGEIGPDSPLCQEYTRDQIGGGSCGQLKRGTDASGNERVEPITFRVKTKMADKLRALELHSKLVGDFEPDRIEVETGPITLESIRERALAVATALAR